MTKTIFKTGALTAHTMDEAAGTFIRVTRTQVAHAGREGDLTFDKVTGFRVPTHPLDGVNGLGFFVFGATISGPADAFRLVRSDRIGRERHETAEGLPLP